MAFAALKNEFVFRRIFATLLDILGGQAFSRSSWHF
jgi:hypothetical protein